MQAPTYIPVTVSLKYCDAMKHEAERKHEDKKEEVFIDTGTELKYLTEM